MKPQDFALAIATILVAKGFTLIVIAILSHYLKTK